jgi:hypothetical protein
LLPPGLADEVRDRLPPDGISTELPAVPTMTSSNEP